MAGVPRLNLSAMASQANTNGFPSSGLSPLSPSARGNGSHGQVVGLGEGGSGSKMHSSGAFTDRGYALDNSLHSMAALSPRMTGGAGHHSARGSLLALGDRESLEMLNREVHELRSQVRVQELQLQEREDLIHKLKLEAAESKNKRKDLEGQLKNMAKSKQSLAEMSRSEQYTIKMLESKVHELQTQRDADPTRSGKYGHLPLPKQVQHLRAENAWLMQYFERFQLSLSHLSGITSMASGDVPADDEQLEQLYTAIKQMQQTQLPNRPRLTMAVDQPPRLLTGTGSALDATMPTSPTQAGYSKSPPATGQLAMDSSRHSEFTPEKIASAENVEVARALHDRTRQLSEEVMHLRESRGRFVATIQSQHTRLERLTSTFDSLNNLLQQSLQRRSSAVPSVEPPPEAQGVESGFGHMLTEVNGRLLLPLSVFDMMEREIKSLQQECGERQVALQERTDEVERLSRNVDVLKHAIQSEKKASKWKSAHSASSSRPAGGGNITGPAPPSFRF